MGTGHFVKDMSFALYPVFGLVFVVVFDFVDAVAFAFVVVVVFAFVFVYPEF